MIYSILVGNQTGLIGPNNDVAAMSSHLTKMGSRPVCITRNYGSVWSEVRKLQRKARKGDTIVFYYSGHGYRRGSRDKWERDGMDEYLPICGGITDDQLFKKLRHKTANHLVILDCCHSGGYDDFLKHKDKNKWCVIAACRESGYSQESVGNYGACGLFTHNLIYGGLDDIKHVQTFKVFGNKSIIPPKLSPWR